MYVLTMAEPDDILDHACGVALTEGVVWIGEENCFDRTVRIIECIFQCWDDSDREGVTEARDGDLQWFNARSDLQQPVKAVCTN